MIKYSLVALAATAVLFSVGCDKGCCGTAAPTAIIAGLSSGQTKTIDSFTLNSTASHDNNDGGSVVSRKWTVDGVAANEGDTLSVGTHKVCLLVTDNDGKTDETCGTVVVSAATNQAPVASFTLASTCTPGEVINLSGNGTDSDGTVTGYKWRVGSTATTADTTITCPASGSQEVCLTVTDNDGKDSTEVCHTTTAAQSDCNPHLSVTDPANGDAEVTGDLTPGNSYDFHNNVVSADCPNIECTYSVKSHNISGLFYTCLIENTYNGISAEEVTNTDKHVQVNGSGSTATINIRTCSSGYDYMIIDLNCTNPVYDESKQYNLN